MTYPSQTKNLWLGGQDIDALSLHSGFPGTTGTNELSGGSYARQANTLAAASGGSRLLSGASVFSVPISTVSWIGAWKVGVFVMAIPNGGATPKNFVAISSTDLIYAPGHGWSDGQKITFFGSPPTGLTEGATYFVRDSATDSFKVAATSGGSVIDLTGSSSAGCWVVAITESVYASAGSHTLASGTVTIPD